MEQVREGSLDIDAALKRLRHMPFEDLGFAKVDHHRALRQGMPEVIFGTGKTPEQVADIARRTAQGRMVSLLEGGYALDALGRSAVQHVRVLAGLNA